jgi:hypothetical protein
MTKTLASVPVHNGTRFAWSGNDGFADVSSFDPSTLAGRLYADACDVGFYVLSERSGNRMLFTEEKVERDAEGETVAWHYVNEAGTIRITVHND